MKRIIIILFVFLHNKNKNKRTARKEEGTYEQMKFPLRAATFFRLRLLKDLVGYISSRYLPKNIYALGSKIALHNFLTPSAIQKY